MPELRQLYELTGQVRPPDMTDLADLADRRRRRGAAVAAGVVTAAVLVAAVVAGVGVGGESTTGPVGPGPSPTPSSDFPVLTAQEIRDHPDATVTPGDDYPATASDVAVRTWSVCLGDCTRETEWLPNEEQSALEISHDDFATGALYRLDLSENISHAVDDWYFVEGVDGPVLVDSRRNQRRLRHGEAGLVSDVAGPLVYARSGLSWIDLRTGVLHPLAGDGDWDWGGAGDTWFWGTAVLVAEDGTVTRHAAVWRGPDGTFAAAVLPVDETRGGPGMLAGRTPGTMAVVEHWAHPRVAHISTDYGATWQVRRVPDAVGSGGRLPADWRTWPPG